MNITPISVATPNFQTAKAVRNVNFTGLAKTAQNIGSAAGEAAANAAKKSGIKDKVTKVLSFAIKGLKNIGHKILNGLKKIFGGNANVNFGSENETYIINGKKVSAEEAATTIKEIAGKLKGKSATGTVNINYFVNDRQVSSAEYEEVIKKFNKAFNKMNDTAQEFSDAVKASCTKKLQVL